VTIKFIYTNVELNLPHHLNYVAALPCKTNTGVNVDIPVTFLNEKCNTVTVKQKLH